MLPERDEHEEILRLRDRLHHAESKLVGIEFMLNDLREWRAQARVQFEGFGVQLEGLVKADELADALAKKMRNERTFHLTIVEKVGAGLFALLLVAIPIIVSKVWP